MAVRGAGGGWVQRGDQVPAMDEDVHEPEPVASRSLSPTQETAQLLTVADRPVDVPPPANAVSGFHGGRGVTADDLTYRKAGHNPLTHDYHGCTEVFGKCWRFNG